MEDLPVQINPNNLNEEPRIFTSEKKKDSKFTNIVIIVLSIALLLIISELGYYLYNKSRITNYKEAQQLKDVSEQNQQTTQKTDPALEKINRIKFDRIVSRYDYYNSLGSLIQKANVIFTFSGTIVSNNPTDEVRYDGVNSVQKIQLKGITGEVVIIYISEEEAKNLTLQTNKNFYDKGTAFEMLKRFKVGDAITITRNTDLLTPSPNNQIEVNAWEP